MKGDPRVIEVLNDVLTAELTAINQYFIHYKMCANWGFDRLAAHMKEESIDEMKDADMLIDRILYLEGVPNMQRYNPVMVGENVLEMHQVDMKLEQDAIARLNNGINVCREIGDNGSRVLLETILQGEEKHLDELEAYLDQIEQVGLQNYLAEQIRA